MDILFEEFFNTDYFVAYFNERLRGRNGGGRDRLTPDDYKIKRADDFETVPLRCCEGRYTFTSYNERLVNKGKGKCPRVISVPSVRDRLVLGVLNRYLQVCLSKLVNRRAPNEYIRSIQNFAVKHSREEVTYLKADFTGFYDNVDRDILMRKLEAKDIDTRAIALVKKAITTPTVSSADTAKVSLEPYGIPQGLAISNLLAALYLEDFDDFMADKAEGYLRYVDDILLLNPVDNIRELIEQYISRHQLHLTLHPDKMKSGVLWKDQFDFIGYSFKDRQTSVRKGNVTGFINRLAKECTEFRKLFFHKTLRPEYLKDDEVYCKTRIELLNMSLTGIKVSGKYYGWTQHFQQIDDLDLLSQLDRIIQHKLLKFLPRQYRGRIASLKRTFYKIYSGKVDDVVTDFDNITRPDQMRAFLIRRGKLNADKEYTDNELVQIYTRFRDRVRKKMEAHIGQRS